MRPYSFPIVSADNASAPVRSGAKPSNRRSDRKPTTDTAEPPKRERCKLCQKSFSTPYNLKQHALKYCQGKPHKCSTCGKSFDKARFLTRHRYRVHVGAKRHKCDTCGKLFLEPWNLRIHEFVHKNERFGCASCDKSFTNPYALRKHERDHGKV